MNYYKARIKHLIRFRHKRGFGVHSPYMFNFILNVLRDKKKTYDYSLLFEKNLQRDKKRRLRLISRVVRYLDIKNLLCMGDDVNMLVDYLAALSCQINTTRVNTFEKIDSVDFIYIGTIFQMQENRFSDLQNLSVDNVRCMFIENIYKDKNNMMLWQYYSSLAQVQIDMLNYGILLFDTKIQKGTYKIKL